MTSEQRTAIARILFDLIRADDILDLAEIRLYQSVKEKYRISESHMIAAQKTDFGAVVGVLGQLGRKELDELLSELKRIANVDGECSQGEALIIMALQYCLDAEISNACRLLVTDITNVSIDMGNVVYVESHYDEDCNATILGNIRGIVNDCGIAGLEFVYIPNIARDFAEMNQCELGNAVDFLAPMLQPAKRQQIIDTLSQITTTDFCEEFLIRHMGLQMLYDCEPSLLLQVCRTDNRIIYLQITLGENVADDLSAFVDRYRILTLSNHNPHVYHRPSSRLIYRGFHRSLFDMLAFVGQDVESRILIDLERRKILFLDLGQELRLPPMQMAQYIFIIQQSLCGKTHELPVDMVSVTRRRALNRSFNRIYGMLGGDQDTDYNKNITPNVSHIRRAINDIEQLDNRAVYLPEKTDDKTLRVRIKPSKVFVLDGERRVLMIENEVWNKM